MFSFSKKAAQDISLPELTEDQLNQVAGGTCSNSSDYNNSKYTHNTHHHHKHHTWHKTTKNTHGSDWKSWNNNWNKTQYGSDKSHW
jgi:hypothetical protein